MGDEQATKLKAGDAQAWSRLYRDHVEDIWRFAYRRTGQCRAAADDLTSETFMAALASIHRYEPRAGSVVRWLYGIARRKVADYLRARGRLRLVNVELDDLVTTTPPGSTEHEQAYVQAILAMLPPPQRDVLLWMYRDEMSVKQIADQLNRTQKAVENLLYRARLRFRELYQTSQNAMAEKEDSCRLSHDPKRAAPSSSTLLRRMPPITEALI